MWLVLKRDHNETYDEMTYWRDVKKMRNKKLMLTPKFIESEKLAYESAKQKWVDEVVRVVEGNIFDGEYEREYILRNEDTGGLDGMPPLTSEVEDNFEILSFHEANFKIEGILSCSNPKCMFMDHNDKIVCVSSHKPLFNKKEVTVCAFCDDDESFYDFYPSPEVIEEVTELVKKRIQNDSTEIVNK